MNLRTERFSALYLALATVLLLLVGAIHAQETVEATEIKSSEEASDYTPTATMIASVEGITEYRLDNGLRVLLFPDNSQQNTLVNITYFVGSRHEAYGETGMAHLLEHLVFKGTPTHPNIPDELTERGVSANGTTWLDRTNYYETFAATDDNLEWALDLESDRMINSFIAKDDLDSEMTVVRNEWESGENNPIGVLYKRLKSAAFNWHNYSNTTIGARSDIENVPIERLQAFYRKYYQPDNAQLMVAGKFDVDRALELVLEKFGRIPRPDRSGANEIFPTYTTEPPQDGERVVTLERVGDIQFVVMGYHIPAGSHPEYPAIDVMAFVMGSGPSSRLYKSLIETQIATSAGAFAESFAEPGLLTMSAAVPKEGSLEDAKATIESTIQEMLDNPPTQEEVDRAKTAFLNNIEVSFRNPMGIGQSMSEWGAMGDWRLLFLYRDRLEQVTPELVHEAAKKYLKSSNRTIGYFRPVDETPPRVVVPATPDVQDMVEGYKGREALAEGEDFDPSLSNIANRSQFMRMSNGAKMAILTKENRGDSVTLRINLRTGTLQTRWGKGYAASMASSMPMRGSLNYSRTEIADEMDRLKLGGSVSNGGITINSDRQNLEESIRFFADIAKNPAWDPEEFELIRKSTLTNLESSRSEPGYKAGYALQKHLSRYEKGHPFYVSSIDEDIEGFENVTLEDAREYYEQTVGIGPGTTITIVGDFDPDVIIPLLEEEFGDWMSSVPYERVPNESQGHPALRTAIEAPDKSNAIMQAGFDFPFTDTHPDYEAMVVASYIMGGGFLNSRLATRIRQKDGLSYGVGANFSAHPIDSRGYFGGYAISAPENSEKVVAAFLEEVEKAVAEGFTNEEVEAAKKGLLDSYQRQRSSDGVISNMLNSDMFYGRDMALREARDDKIAGLTAEEVSTAFAKHIDPNKISIVTSGDFAKVAVESGE